MAKWHYLAVHITLDEDISHIYTAWVQPGQLLNFSKETGTIRNHSIMQEILDYFGEDGWELVNVVQGIYFRDRNFPDEKLEPLWEYIAFFKQEEKR